MNVVVKISLLYCY